MKKSIFGNVRYNTPANVPKVLFDTVFAGLTLGTPTPLGGSSKNWITSFTATTDTITGFDVDTDIKALFGNLSTLSIVSIPESQWVNIGDYNTYIANTLSASTYKNGAQELELNCLVREALGPSNPQTGLTITIPGSNAVANPFRTGCLEILFKLPVGLDTNNAGNDDSTGNFYTILEIKKGGYFDTPTYKTSIGDWRLLIGVDGLTGTDKYEIRIDDQANGYGTIPGIGAPGSPNTFYQQSIDAPIRTGVWQTLWLNLNLPELHTDLDSGIVQAVIACSGYDDIVLCNLNKDGLTQLAGVADLPVTRIFINNYTSAELPNPLKVGRFRLWDKAPRFMGWSEPVAVNLSLAGGATQPREGTDTLSIDFTSSTPTQVTIARNGNSEFAVWPDGNLSQYFTAVTGGLEFYLSLAHMNLGVNTVGIKAIYDDYRKATDSLSLTIEEVIELDPEEISVAMAGGLTQYQTGIDTLQITFVNGTPVAVNIARNDNVTFAQWPTGNLYQYFREVSGGLEFDLDLSYLNLGENSLGVTATYSDASTAEAFLTLHISEVEEAPPPTPPSPLPAFPGAEGFGAAAVGGRGGTVLFVENLNDSGPGSLRTALMAEYPRTVIFRVGGTIDLLSDISISGASRSYLTVAGQTAPGGIQTRYKTIEMSNGIHDVIIRFLRHRRGWEDYTPGEAESNNHGPGLTIYSYGDPCYNIIIDHCSFAWQQDDNSFWQSVHDVTWQWCIMAEAKNPLVDGDPVPLKGVNGKGWIGGTEDGDGALMYNVSLHHNFMAHNYQRSPLVKGAGPFEIVNNLVYNWAAFGTSIDYTNAAGSKVNLIGNYYKEGPDAFDRYAVTINDATHPADMIYVSDNISPQRTSGAQDEWDVMGLCDGSPYCNTPASNVYQKDTAWAASDYPITIADAVDVPALVLAGVGATLPARDATDTRIVSEYHLSVGSIHTYNSWPTITGTTAPTDADNDGMADSWETSEGVTDPNGVAANGYTNMENYINSVV